MLRKPLLSLLLSASVLSAACSRDEQKPAVLIIDREEADFGELEVGRSSPEHLFTVRNASPSAVESVSVKVEGSGFTITANTCERFLDAGRECEVRVRFSPRLAGPSEARLEVEGAPDVDSAVLKGMGVGYVEVLSLPGGGARVVAEGEGWSCDEPCRMPVRQAQVTLRAEPAGIPTWGGACAVVAGGGCSLVMDGTKVVSLEALESLLRWEARRGSHPRSVAVSAGGDIVVLEVGQLQRLSSTGQLRWSVPLSGGVEMALDGASNAYVVDSSGRVTRYDTHGQVLWTSSESVENPGWHELAVSASGNVYVLLSLGNHELARQLELIAISPQAAKRWSLRFNEGQFNYASGLAVNDQGEVYLSGSVFNRNATSGESVFVKSYLRKYSAEGAILWESQDGWDLFAVNAEGATSTLLPNTSPSTRGFTQRWIGANGVTQWTATIPNGPGVVTLQTFAHSGALLVGGHEPLAVGTEFGRGWFAAMNLTTRVLGPVTYVEGSTGMGGPVRISDLALTPAGHVVVTGGFGAVTDQGEGYIRVYDGRVLTGVP
ncbi:PQQ-binding-like beta-propeller repeat protein [Myxococcus sp. SDU36]|uniref:PQQ-binding-like beta-propeller repeat protein n=1 Tax=Myxococcus sp. SDU36 TaxID=2831967 RepID=UPI0025426FBA|nr:PQQ-binding-like beta-propeller repeat protein [Myxococcus sp. SDU36]WIG93957.1 PQQ-binding-like beta-propeller repeat protein [Myxococcus sp. SDU36]